MIIVCEPQPHRQVCNGSHLQQSVLHDHHSPSSLLFQSRVKACIFVFVGLLLRTLCLSALQVRRRIEGNSASVKKQAEAKRVFDVPHHGFIMRKCKGRERRKSIVGAALCQVCSFAWHFILCASLSQFKQDCRNAVSPAAEICAIHVQAQCLLLRMTGRQQGWGFAVQQRITATCALQAGCLCCLETVSQLQWRMMNRRLKRLNRLWQKLLQPELQVWTHS